MNATPRPWKTATELQHARECVAATINQDETLTIQEAREHAFQALNHIEQAEEAFDAMREALQLIVAWNRSGGASSLEEARELTYRKAQAALALAKGEQ